MSTQATVHIVDDDDSLRCALGRLLRAKGYETKAYKSGSDFLCSWTGGPGCLILDVCMPEGGGLELYERLAKNNPLPVIFLTGRGDISMGVRAMKGGAVDFLTKPFEQEELVSAVNAALVRDAENRGGKEHLQALRERYLMLSPREREVFLRVAEGKLNKQIASDLGISERTVKAHRGHVMEKLNLHSVADLVRTADEMKGVLAAGGPNSRDEKSVSH